MSIKRYLSGELWEGKFRRTLWIVLGGLLILGLLFGPRLVELYTDWLWFIDAGYRGVFRRILWVQAGLMVAVAAFFFAMVYTNLWLARSHGPRPRLYLDETHQFRLRFAEFGRQTVALLTLVAAIVISLTVGMAAATGWYNFILYRNAVPFGVTDPIFGRDVAFYVFTLPFLRFVYQWVGIAAVLSFFGVAAIYFADRQIDFGAGLPRVSAQARTHLSVLLGAAFIIKAIGYWLARYGVLFSQQRLFSGAGYTDVNVRVPALAVLSVLAFVVGISLFIYARFQNPRVPIAAAGLWLVASFVGGVVAPAFVQQVRVTPNELTAEGPYIRHSIKATRDAFNLSKIQHSSFNADGALTANSINGNADTMKNIRLWDEAPLAEAYQQLQGMRPYYVFGSADMDRYYFPDGLRQVGLSVRELDVSKLPRAAQGSWINRHLIYTHGYGLCMSPVNVVTASGLPDLIIKDFPNPQDTPPRLKTPAELPLTRPQIYFGEAMDSDVDSPDSDGPDYVVVNTGEKEHDYPSGAENVPTRYAGHAGVGVGNWWRRFLFALRFGDQNILLSSQIQRDSRILFERNVRRRVQRIAPFLRLDGDPYPVVYDNHVVWIADAYTVTPWYPYADRYHNPQAPDARFNFNYIRNSVKATVDAYDGSVRLYLIDPKDPLAASLNKAFPGLLRPIGQMPAGLRSHLRYPMDLFMYQSLMYSIYHMEDPRVFYNREDLWALPAQRQDGSSQGAQSAALPAMQPYYTVMKLPNGDRAEYILMLPFTPNGRSNMIAWMAGRSDGSHLGELVVYNFPKQKVIYGPQQVDTLIDQNPQISEKLTLWNQNGSSVLRAPVMAIPMDNALLYVEPLYLHANNNKMPELKQVFVVYRDQVEMAPTLGEALGRIFQGKINAQAEASPEEDTAKPTPSQPAPQPAAGAPSAEMRQLAREANDRYTRAQDAVRKGDWAAYGEEMKKLGEAVGKMQRLAGE